MSFDGLPPPPGWNTYNTMNDSQRKALEAARQSIGWIDCSLPDAQEHYFLAGHAAGVAHQRAEAAAICQYEAQSWGKEGRAACNVCASRIKEQTPCQR